MTRKSNSIINMSINTEIDPGILIPDTSLWYKIDYENKSYLCINGPLSQSGVGMATGQYYIIENAFSKNER